MAMPTGSRLVCTETPQTESGRQCPGAATREPVARIMSRSGCGLAARHVLWEPRRRERRRLDGPEHERPSGEGSDYPAVCASTKGLVVATSSAAGNSLAPRRCGEHVHCNARGNGDRRIIIRGATKIARSKTLRRSDRWPTID